MAEGQARRKLAAIVSADVVGYSRLMRDDEAATVLTLKEYRAAVARVIDRHGGRIVNAPGDNILAEFPSAVEAVHAAVEVQKNIEGRNAELADERRMHFRVGVNLGDVIEEDDGTIYGDGVNIAARMEALAEAGGVCVASTVYDAVEGKLDFGFDFLGEQSVKNIAKPVQVYRVRSDARAAPVAVKSRRSLLFGAAATIIVALIVAGTAIWFFSSRPPAPVEEAGVPPPDKPSIAVLPFANLDGDPEQDYFADGITEDIITDLSGHRGMFVIARNSTFRYKGQAVDVTEIGREFGVRYVVEGSVRRSGDRVRITAQLIDAATGGHVWADRYDRNLTDVFAVQDDVTRQIVTALNIELGGTDDARARLAVTGNVEAYDLFLRGRAYKKRATKEANVKAREFFEQALALDPSLAAAHAELSYVHFRDFYFGWRPDLGTLERALNAAEQAVALRDDLPLAHARLGWILLWRGELDQAIAEGERAVALDPNFAEGYEMLSGVFAFAGRTEQAIAAADKTGRLDPYSFVARFQSGLAYFGARQYEKAIADLKATLVLNPDFPVAHQVLAGVYGLLGRDAEARAEAAEVLRLSPDFAPNIWRMPFKDRAVLERLVDGLRKAGLEVPDKATRPSP